MTDAAKEKKREYERRWRAQNPERVKAIKERYWEKKASQDESNGEVTTCENDSGSSDI